MKIVAIRHLPTEYNRLGLLQGRRDEPILSPSVETLQKIEQNKVYLDSYGRFDKVLVSSLQRTHMTADAYGYENDYLADESLDELDFGRFEGKSRASMLESLGDAWTEAPHKLVLGEPLQVLAGRVQTMLDTYSNCTSILIFGHGAWLRALISIVETGDIKQMNKMHIENNSLRLLDSDAKKR